MSDTDPRYRMTIDLNVLDHLADGLYSSVAAVLTETVANAWDADAGNVRIHIDEDRIEIEDDGVGMNEEHINNRYLRVGYRRRDESNYSKEGRPVMGRKGIGKLSLFSIAESIEIYTRMKDAPVLGLRISAHKLRKAMEDQLGTYNPEPIDSPPERFIAEHGTLIIASELRRKRLRDIDPASLKRRIARRFSVIGKDNEGVVGASEFHRGFHVFVNDEEITVADREDLKFVEYLWQFGGTQVSLEHSGLSSSTENIAGRDDDWQEKRMDGWIVRGWIGTVDRPKRLATPEGSLNSIVLLSRGRLVDEDVLPRIVGAEMYTKYLTGQIEADFLDDGVSDIVTSNRQKIIEDDERFVALIGFLKKSLRKIAETWSDMRNRDKSKQLVDLYPGVEMWLHRLPSAWRAKAEKLLQRIATLEIGEDEAGRETLLRHAVFGFERLRLRGDAEELAQALEKGVEQLLCLLAGRDSLEASFYADIVSNRLDVIRELDKLVGNNEIEKVLQRYLFDHLWLLDPSWERASGSESMEERLRLRSTFRDDVETKEQYGRVDIRYRSVAGKHVIVELKRASVNISLTDLYDQGAKYVKALEDLIEDSGEKSPIEVVFVVGRKIQGDPSRIKRTMDAINPGSRIMTYDTLICSAKAAYDSYLAKAREADEIEKIFNAPSRSLQENNPILQAQFLPENEKALQ